MPERPSFLPPAEFTQLAPEPDGFSGALGRARRRRRRQLGEGGVVLALAVALVANVPLPSRDVGQDRVDVISDTGERQGLDERPDEFVLPLPPSDPLQTPTATPPPRTRPATATASDVAAAPVPAPAPRAPRPAAQAQADPGLAYKKPVTRSQSTSLSGTCFTDDWCLQASARRVQDEANRYLLSLQLCRAIDAPSGTLDFSTNREAEFVVHDDEEDLWTWSRGQRFPSDPETITVSAGSCYTWSTDYALTVDDNGYLLRKGTYTVRVWSAAEQLGADRFATTQITVE